MSLLPPKNVQRDRLICKLYTDGCTSSDLSVRFELTRSRVQQIIKTSGIVPHNRSPKKNRDEFLGVNLTDSVKRALKDEANKRGLSMSNLTSKTLAEMLTALGYKVVDDHGQPTVVEEK